MRAGLLSFVVILLSGVLVACSTSATDTVVLAAGTASAAPQASPSVAPSTVASTAPGAVTGQSTEGLDPQLLGGLAVEVRTRSTFKPRTHVTWPLFGLATVDHAISGHVQRSRHDFRKSYAGTGKKGVAQGPELNLGWRLVGASPNAVGIAIDTVIFAGGTTTESSRSFWFDPATGHLLPATSTEAQAAAASPTLVAPTSPSTTPPRVRQPRRSQVNCAKVKCVALTFDDGPGPDTERLLSYLRKGKVRATFFMLGQQVKAYPKVAKDVARAGHEIGVHTWDHQDLTRLSKADVAAELGDTVRIIGKDTGVTPTLLRPPYGATNARVEAAAARAHLAVALWDVDTLDWKTRSTQATIASALHDTRRGSIVLIHDIHATSVAAVPAIIRGLRHRGYRFVTVSQLLGHPKPGKKYFRRG
ncbi:polysaccharide deacetylase family protein [Nocardioides sp.]|uniref:polysaccharide deacetylase family protein n=1 Tax=Nocardioides sp. TaxID=35761 RepID=UPI0039E260AC